MEQPGCGFVYPAERMRAMSDAPAARPRVLSGIQPTADSFHFGNYLGAVRQWVALQEDYDPFFFIADMHAITGPATTRRCCAAGRWPLPPS